MNLIYLLLFIQALTISGIIFALYKKTRKHNDNLARLKVHLSDQKREIDDHHDRIGSIYKHVFTDHHHKKNEHVDHQHPKRYIIKTHFKGAHGYVKFKHQDIHLVHMREHASQYDSPEIAQEWLERAKIQNVHLDYKVVSYEG